MAGEISLLLLPFPCLAKVKSVISHSSSEEQLWRDLSYLDKTYSLRFGDAAMQAQNI